MGAEGLSRSMCVCVHVYLHARAHVLFMHACADMLVCLPLHVMRMFPLMPMGEDETEYAQILPKTPAGRSSVPWHFSKFQAYSNTMLSNVPLPALPSYCMPAYTTPLNHTLNSPPSCHPM